MPLLEMGLSSEVLGTLHAELLHPVSERLVVGGGVEVPLTLWLSSGRPTTARLMGEIRWQAWSSGVFSLQTEGAVRLAVQDDLLGPRLALDSVLGLWPTARWGTVTLGPRGGWEQPLATLLTFSDYAQAAFEDSGTPPPQAGVVPFGLGRGYLGAAIAVPLGKRMEFRVQLDALLSPDHLETTWSQRLTAGVWPARLALQLQVPLGGAP